MIDHPGDDPTTDQPETEPEDDAGSNEPVGKGDGDGGDSSGDVPKYILLPLGTILLIAIVAVILCCGSVCFCRGWF